MTDSSPDTGETIAPDAVAIAATDAAAIAEGMITPRHSPVVVHLVDSPGE